MYSFGKDEIDRKVCRNIIPEVEVFGHVHLLKYIQQTLFLGLFVDLLVDAYRDDFGTLAVVKVVPAKQRNV